MIKKLENLKIIRKISVISIISITSLVALGILSLIFLTMIYKSSKTITDNSLPAIISAEEIDSLVSDYRTREYNYVMNINISEKEKLVLELEKKKKEVDSSLDNYKLLVHGNDDKKILENIKTMWNTYMDSSTECIKESTKGNQTKAMRVMKGNVEEYDQMSSMLDQLVAYNKNRVDSAGSFVAKMYFLAVAFVIAACIFIIFAALFLTKAISRSIINPIKEIDNAAREIADEKLDVIINYDSEDELGVLARNFNKTVERLGGYIHYIDEITDILNEISKGNLDFRLHNEYTGEFHKVKKALMEISDSLSSTLKQINASSELVADSSGKLSQGSDVLAEGVAKQAGTLDILMSEIEEISGRIQKNADYAHETNEMVSNTREEVVHSNEKMLQMIRAMEEINEKSGQIAEIVTAIEDIASKTNLLSLNAAIEAARAGEAGRGFSVVADQVKELAAQCTKATKKTAVLINDSMNAVKAGSDIANNTAASLDKVVHNISKVAVTMSDIAEASVNQAESIRHIEDGVENIYAVVQSNSATSENSAQASKELSNQAQMLKELVYRFQLKSIS